MARNQSSSSRAKRALKSQQDSIKPNKAKIIQPKQKKINKTAINKRQTLPSQAELSKMSNRAKTSKISKQDYTLKEKAATEVSRMAKTLNRRLNKFKNEEGFDERRSRIDVEERKKVEAEKEKYDSGQIDLHDSKYYAGYQVYQQILEMIRDSQSPKNPPFMVTHSQSLYEVMQKEIRQFGFDRVMKSMAEAPEELVYYARRSIEDSDDEMSRSYRFNLVMLIEGNIPSTEEAKDINEYEESNREQTPEDYDRAEDTSWRTATEEEIPEGW